MSDLMGRFLQQLVGAGSKPFSGPLPTCPARGLFACLHGLRRLASFLPALLGAAPLASFLLALLGAAPLAEASAAKAPCPPATVVDWIETVTEDGEPVLRSSGPVRLMGLRLPDEAPSRTAALTWLRGRQGREVLVQGAPARDRWGRLPARLVLAGQAERLDVAHGLVESGLALVDTATGEGACTPETLALEATARDRGLGLWAEDRYKPVPVGDVTRLRERIGQFTLVEGRIRSVGERRQQTYLNFGTDWATDFTIVLPKRVWTLLQERGLGRAALEGRRIRARGILEERQGPALTISAPEAVEVLDEPTRR
ncbi:MAG TPA: thermonuclease family protein [Gaiellaceae bacterium]|nr:thermonuclease family protein [Gaiellaceae bacterium]